MLRAQLGELTSRLTDLQLAADRPPNPLHLVLAKQPAPKIEVAVLSAQGAPLAGAVVFLEEEGKGQRLLTTDGQGRAASTLEPPLPAQVRAAAYTPAGWILGAWTGLDAARDGLTLQAAPVGSLLLESSRPGEVRIVSQTGWDLTWLLRQLGAPPLLDATTPLPIDGLPEGAYSLTRGASHLQVAVEPGKAAAVKLP